MSPLSEDDQALLRSVAVWANCDPRIDAVHRLEINGLLGIIENMIKDRRPRGASAEHIRHLREALRHQQEATAALEPRPDSP